MNFDVIKKMFPNHGYKIDEIIRRDGVQKAHNKLFGCFSKVINVLCDSDLDLLITKKKSKEKRIADLNNVKNKCDKIIKKQERKKTHIETKIEEVEEEPDEVMDQFVMNQVIVVEEKDEHRIRLLESQLEESEIKLKQLIKENSLLSIGNSTIKALQTMKTSRVHETAESGTQCDFEHELKNDIVNMGTQTETVEDHEHSTNCSGCKIFSDKERAARFGDAHAALDVMKKLNRHNFLQPNKHETILLVKEAMASIKGSIKHKFSLFLSDKMLELCDLLLLTFNQVQNESDRQYREIMKHLDSLK